jgi:hypothetical protein
MGFLPDGSIVDGIMETVQNDCLRRDGSKPMNNDYEPTNDQDIATKKYVDDNVGEGGDGEDGASAFCYVRYATDDQGAEFSSSPSGKTYVAIKTTATEIENPVAEDFTGLWTKFVGDNGSPGAQGSPGPNINFNSTSAGTINAHTAVVPEGAGLTRFAMAKADTLANCKGLIGRNNAYVSSADSAITIHTSHGHSFTHSSYNNSSHVGKILYLGTDGVPTTTPPSAEGNVVYQLFVVIDETGLCIWCPQFLGVVPAS